MSDLPKIAVIGDVAVERRIGGELLLYRLLAGYPPDRVRMVHGALIDPQPDLRLPGRTYADVSYLPKRVFYNQFSKYTTLAVYPSLGLIRQRVERALDSFRPDVVVMVSHGWLWLAGMRLAEHNGIRSVLICYDDWQSFGSFPGLRKRKFGRAYRTADARLCVCSSMAELYEREYGVSADVLWPNRGPDSPTPAIRVRSHDGPLTAIFAGSLYSDSYAAVAAVAEALGRAGGQVHVYSPHTLGPLADIKNVRHCGFVSPAELAARAGDTADLLFAPMNFTEAGRRLAMTSFSSKLADYTAIGLPILVCGPEYCSAIRWAAEYPGVAAVATRPTADALAAALQPLADPAARLALAARAAEVGGRMFGLAAAEATFLAAVTGRSVTELDRGAGRECSR